MNEGARGGPDCHASVVAAKVRFEGFRCEAVDEGRGRVSEKPMVDGGDVRRDERGHLVVPLCHACVRQGLYMFCAVVCGRDWKLEVSPTTCGEPVSMAVVLAETMCRIVSSYADFSIAVRTSCRRYAPVRYAFRPFTAVSRRVKT